MAVSVSYSFSPTTTIESSQVNQNFTDLVGYINDTACVTGMVVMWDGSIASIPTGWSLCNGSGSTPDLRDKFIVGAGNTYSYQATGGEATHTLTSAEMPSHTHTGPSHSHGVNDPGHAHPIRHRDDRDANLNVDAGNTSPSDTGQGSLATDTSVLGNATTGISIQAGGTGNTGSAGSGNAHNNLPPYYALAFIRKD